MASQNSTLLKQPIVARFGERFGMEADEVLNILRSTAFKVKDGQATDAQMCALMVVADQYKLNPFTKEIYAYPDKQNGIVPVVGVDGWARIINEHPMLDGVEFAYSEGTLTHKGKTCHEWIECTIYRKDRSKPTVIREAFDEVVRSTNFTTPWDTHPKRMHRHKALIQCARLAFGFAGIYDDDEAARIVEGMQQNPGKTIDPTTGEIVARTLAPAAPVALPPYSDADFEKNLPAWRGLIESGRRTAGDIIFMVSTKASMSEEQIAMVSATVTPEPQIQE